MIGALLPGSMGISPRRALTSDDLPWPAQAATGRAQEAAPGQAQETAVLDQPECARLAAEEELDGQRKQKGF